VVRTKAASVRSSLAYKVYIIVISSIAFCAVLIGMYYYRESKALIREGIGSDLRKQAQAAAIQINGELFESIKSTQDLFYKPLKTCL
jgi:hypothetical protein